MADAGVHRVAVVSSRDVEQRIDGVVTQTDVLRAVHAHMGSLGVLASAQVGSLFPTADDSRAAAPFTLPASSTLRHCFQQLLARHLSGAALVDDATGAVVANVSVSDIRRLGGAVVRGDADAQALLDGPVLRFIAGGGGDSSSSSGGGRPVVSVVPSDSLATVVEMMVVAGVKRVHVVDRARRPIGVVTVSDVLRLLLSHDLTAHCHHDSIASFECASPLEGEAAADAAIAAAATGSVPPSSSASSGTPTSGPSPTGATSPVSAGATPGAEPSLLALLQSTTIGDVMAATGVPIDDVVDVGTDSKMTEALAVMRAHKLSAVMVSRYVVTSWSPRSAIPVTAKKYVGWVDGGDVAALVLQRSVSDRSGGGVLTGIAAALHDDDGHTAAAAVNFSNNDPLWVVHRDKTMDKVRQGGSRVGCSGVAGEYAGHCCKTAVTMFWGVRVWMHVVAGE